MCYDLLKYAYSVSWSALGGRQPFPFLTLDEGVLSNPSQGIIGTFAGRNHAVDVTVSRSAFVVVGDFVPCTLDRTSCSQVRLAMPRRTIDNRFHTPQNRRYVIDDNGTSTREDETPCLRRDGGSRTCGRSSSDLAKRARKRVGLDAQVESRCESDHLRSSGGR